MKTEQWEEASRREIGVVAHMAPEVGATFALLYEVTEVVRNEKGTPIKWRERMVHGATIYQAKQMLVADGALLEVVAKGVKALSHIARGEDERISAAKRATSRRKAR